MVRSVYEVTFYIVACILDAVADALRTHTQVRCFLHLIEFIVFFRNTQSLPARRRTPPKTQNQNVWGLHSHVGLRSGERNSGQRT